MVFIDPLSSQLLVLLFSSVFGLYVILKCYLSLKKGGELKSELLSSFLPVLFLGFFAFITGLYGMLFWPLPGSYNILFYDVYTIFGLLLMGWAWSFYKGIKLEYIGFASLLLGAATVYYGYSGYVLSMTKSPVAFLALYGSFGASGILIYPCSMILDRMLANRNYMKNYRKKMWLFALLVLALIIASIVTAIILVPAIPAHLASPP